MKIAFYEVIYVLNVRYKRKLQSHHVTRKWENEKYIQTFIMMTAYLYPKKMVENS